MWLNKSKHVEKKKVLFKGLAFTADQLVHICNNLNTMLSDERKWCSFARRASSVLVWDNDANLRQAAMRYASLTL